MSIQWDIKLYDTSGTPLETNDLQLDVRDNIIHHAFNRQWTLNLNNFDQLDFSIYLDDPMADQVERGSSVVKLFRSVSRNDGTVLLDEELPSFCGVVGYTQKNFNDNIMNISAYSPLWRLQFHFHLLNHYLDINPDTAQTYTQSELMWKMIDLVNEAFGGDSHTGMAIGDFSWGLPNEPQIGPYFLSKGTNTWSNIFDDLMQRVSSPDIRPGYIHVDGHEVMMEFNTDQKRGTDREDDFVFSFKWFEDARDNLEDIVEEVQLVPNEFGNYLWTVGAGGPNTGRFAAAQHATGTDSTSDIGVYMVQLRHDEVTRFRGLPALAQAELEKRKHPIATYTLTMEPAQASDTYYDFDYKLGDVVKTYAWRPYGQIEGVKLRIYQAIITMSDNNLEIPELYVAKDFFGQVEGSG